MLGSSIANRLWTRSPRTLMGTIFSLLGATALLMWAGACSDTGDPSPVLPIGADGSRDSASDTAADTKIAPTDGSLQDASDRDIQTADGGPPDVSVVDGVAPDGASQDAKVPDATDRDISVQDVRPADSAEPDAKDHDADASDTAVPDSGVADADASENPDADSATVDAGTSDVISLDVSQTDATPPDANPVDTGVADVRDAAQTCCLTKISFIAPTAAMSVELMGSPAPLNWTAGSSIPMTQEATAWVATVCLPFNKDILYKFRLDENNWVYDPKGLGGIVSDGYNGYNNHIAPFSECPIPSGSTGP